MATKGFTKIINSIIFDLDLTLEAIGLYTKLQHLSTTPNFSIKRNYVKSICGCGETAFRRIWGELKSKGVLLENKTRIKGKYQYAYTLKNNEETLKVAPPEEKRRPEVKHVDSDGNAPIPRQISIEEVLETEKHQEVFISNENIKVVAEATGLTNIEAHELLKEASNDVNKIINCHKYTIAQDNVKNIFNYTKWAIKNNKVLNNTKEQGIKHDFCDYPQRVYDFGKLERALLYGEEYDLPA